MSEPAQTIIDNEHLKLLRFGYLISGAWNVLFVFFPLLYVAMGVFLITASSQNAMDETPPREVGLMLVVIGCTISAVMAVISTLKLLTARAIGRRTSRMLCLVTAAITSFALPYNTALGVATMLVLSRPSIRQQFDPQSIPPSAA